LDSDGGIAMKAPMKSLSVLLAAIVLLAAPTIKTQEHAPTVSTCRADLNLWSGLLAVQGPEGDPKLSYREIESRIGEMTACAVVDDPEGYHYAQTSERYLIFLVKRDKGFLRRHNLWQQLLDEDAAGVR
jgi:hypothetical protein